MLTQSKNQEFLPHIVCFLVALIFSFHYIAAKKILGEGVAPLCLAGCRGLFGGTFLLFLYRKKFNLGMIKKSFFSILIISFFGFFLNQILFMHGLSMTKPIYAALISNTIPVVILLLALLFKLENFSLKKSLLITISLILVCYLILFSETQNHSQIFSMGNLFIFLNVVLFSFSFIKSKKLLEQNFPYEILSGLTLFIGGSILTLITLPKMSTLETYLAQGHESYLLMIFEVFISTSLVYLLNAWTLSKLEASTVAYFTYFQPVLTAVLAFFLYQTTPQSSFLFIYTGILLCGISLLRK